MHRFLGLEMLWTIFIEQFVFRFEPIFEVVANQPAVGAVDLMSAIHNAFDR
jgi:hypothetical protein